MLHNNLNVSEQGHLTFAGLDTVELAKEFGTPAYLIDENMILGNIKTYQSAMREFMGEGSEPLFASKALSYCDIYRLMSEVDACIDVVSPGELYTADKAGFNLKRAFFHGSNKTDADIALGLEKGVGHFVVDNVFELEEISKQAGEKGITQKILLRVTPGIDPHTHAKINTGKVDSKFGAPIETGMAEKLFCKVMDTPNVDLRGFHSHIGSQIFETEPFSDAARIMLEFVAMLKSKYDFDTEYLNLGGGFGIRYTESDPQIDYAERIKKLADEIKGHCDDFGITQPKILMEPGRSIVGAAGCTIYEIGATKEIEGFKNYASVDGGMTDNPRYALYQSPYTCLLANKMNDVADFTCTIAGRCCESGDLIQEDVTIPKPTRGDILAVLCTGAYNYAMASNYNRVPRPPIVAIRDGKARVSVRRETYADLCSLDV